MNLYWRTGAVALLVMVLPAASRAAQNEPQTKPPVVSADELRKALGSPETVTATVSAIDYDDRVVVLRDDAGMDHALYVGQDVAKFKNLKAGDKIRATYYFSLATQLLRPEEAGRPGTTTGVVGTTGNTPGGTVSEQTRWVVRVDAVDREKGTLTLTGPKGRSVTVIPSDKSRLADVKPNDRLEVTMTAAAVIDVQPAN